MKDAWKNCLDLYSANKIEKAEKMIQKFIKKNPKASGAYQLEALCRLRMDDVENSVRLIDKAIEVDPKSACAHSQKGVIMQRVRKFNEAEKCFLTAINLDPMFELPHHQLAYVDLTLGRYMQGWENFELRVNLMPDAFPYIKVFGREKLWQKWEDMNGKKIVVITEQGHGDAIQFARYLPLLREKVDCHVTFCCYNSVASLLKNSGIKADQWIRFDAGGQLMVPAGFDRFCLLMSLPYLLGINEPAPLLPLVSDSPRVLPEPNAFNIIISHAGNSKHENDSWRSCHLSHFAKLADIPGVKLHTLQPIKRLNDGCDFPIHDLSKTVKNFEDSAAYVKKANLVITVDTALVHLAGSVGTETWLTLPYYGEWRWGTSPDRSDWYPSVQLFRQDRPGNWEGVFRRVERLVRTKLRPSI